MKATPTKEQTMKTATTLSAEALDLGWDIDPDYLDCDEVDRTVTQLRAMNPALREQIVPMLNDGWDFDHALANLRGW